MNFGLHVLLTSCLALLALPVFFLAPGYVAASATDLLHFRTRSWIERLLWATALSQPVALLFTVHPGIGLSPHVTTACFLLTAAIAAALALRDRRNSAAGLPAKVAWDRYATVAACAAAALVPYVLLSTVPVELHGRLYESSVWQDWDIRIQLVNAAIRGGNHPGNPMFAANGQPAPLRYYYFWYVLCARMHDLIPVNPRAILTASCVGSALSLFAFLLLALKYLSASAMPARRQGAAALVVACILGLDLLPFTLALLFHRFYPDLQFWLDDRSPGWLHMMIWSPHHVAGLVCCGLGALLFVRALDVSRRQQLVHGVLAGICFAASAGTSTFITVLFAMACLAVFADALRRRERAVLLSMLVGTIVGAVLIAPFLHRLLEIPSGAAVSMAPAATEHAPPSGGTPALSGNSSHVFTPTHRYKNQAMNYLWLALTKVDKSIKHHPGPGDPNFNKIKWMMRVFRPPVVVGLFLCDFGFFAFVLVYQARKDFRSPGPIPRAARVLWLLFTGIAVPGCFLSSGGLQGNNDFGRHAGFCMRFLLLLWATPLVADFLARWRDTRHAHIPLPLSRAARWAVAFAGIGLLGQLAQILLVRLRFPLTDAGLVPYVVVDERLARPAFRFGQVQRAMAAAAAITPPDGIVQGNPHSRVRDVYLLYTDRQMAAADDGCNVPFGGDPKVCLPMAKALIGLFGGMGRPYQGMPGIFLYNYIHFDPAAVTPENFARVCAAYKIDTLVASFVDPAWWDRSSWVWQMHPVFANSTARVFPCAQPAPVPSRAVPESTQPPYTRD